MDAAWLITRPHPSHSLADESYFLILKKESSYDKPS
jgi:hypothetical protein